MDLNRLYSDHQLLVMQPRGTVPGSPHGSAAAARLVAARIGRIQRRLGASGAPGWEALASARCSAA